jgi:hypothetical protein
MKKLLSASQFVLATLLGTYSMYVAISGKLHTSAAAEIFVFSLGFAIFTVSVYAIIKTLVQKS